MHRPRDGLRDLGDPRRMAGRPRRLGVDGPRQRLERPDAERVQLGELALQVAGHGVERFAQCLQLVAGAHVHAGLELAAREARRAVPEAGNRIEEPTIWWRLTSRITQMVATTTRPTVRTSACAGATASAVRVTTTLVHWTSPNWERIGADQ